MRAQLVAHGPLNTNGAALPIETGAELQIGPNVTPRALRVSENRAGVTRRPSVRAPEMLIGPHEDHFVGPLADDAAADDSTGASLSWTSRIPDSGLQTPLSPRSRLAAHHR